MRIQYAKSVPLKKCLCMCTKPVLTGGLVILILHVSQYIGFKSKLDLYFFIIRYMYIMHIVQNEALHIDPPKLCDT